MAGLGRKTFVSGDVLTAAEMNGYIMEQSVMLFASAATRTTAIPSPSQGMVTYRIDASAVEAYNGTAWVAIAGGGAGLQDIFLLMGA